MKRVNITSLNETLISPWAIMHSNVAYILTSIKFEMRCIAVQELRREKQFEFNLNEGDGN